MFLGMSYSDWAIGILAALLVGLGKGGLPGTSNLSIILMAMIFPSKASVGVLLPVLICADVVAVSIYHQHTRWKHLVRLLPWTLIGIGAGAFIFKSIDDQIMTRAIGGTLLFMVAITPLRKFFEQHQQMSNEGKEKTSLGLRVFIGSTGILGGIATMVANAAGPVIGIYLMVSRLPKFEFIGTSAWFFFIINLCKVPVQIGIGNINWSSMKISLLFGIFAMLAAWIAPKIVHRIPQKVFSFLIWFFIIVAGLKMLLM